MLMVLSTLPSQPVLDPARTADIASVFFFFWFFSLCLPKLRLSTDLAYTHCLEARVPFTRHPLLGTFLLLGTSLRICAAAEPIGNALHTSRTRCHLPPGWLVLYPTCPPW